jgi:hypothetical protein
MNGSARRGEVYSALCAVDKYILLFTITQWREVGDSAERSARWLSAYLYCLTPSFLFEVTV